MWPAYISGFVNKSLTYLIRHYTVSTPEKDNSWDPDIAFEWKSEQDPQTLDCPNVKVFHQMIISMHHTHTWCVSISIITTRKTNRIRNLTLGGGGDGEFFGNEEISSFTFQRFLVSRRFLAMRRRSKPLAYVLGIIISGFICFGLLHYNWIDDDHTIIKRSIHRFERGENDFWSFGEEEIYCDK